MPTWGIFGLFALGLLLIIKGGDLFVDAATWIAEVSGIPKFLIGATIVSLATTLPELTVSLIAALGGRVGLAVGNAVGSVTANIGLIMGVSIVCLPAAMSRKQIGLKALLMALSGFLLWFLCRSGQLQLGGAMLILTVFIFFLLQNVHEAKASMNSASSERPKVERRAAIVTIMKFVLGAAGIFFGAQLLVDYGSAIARLAGVPEDIIGVTLVAVGTALPELVTTLTAIRKKQAALSIGNILGANIIDLTLILPACALASGGALPVPRQALTLDIPVLLLLIALSMLPTVLREKFSRAQGVLMLCLYAAYMAALCVSSLVL